MWFSGEGIIHRTETERLRNHITFQTETIIYNRHSGDVFSGEGIIHRIERPEESHHCACRNHLPSLFSLMVRWWWAQYPALRMSLNPNNPCTWGLRMINLKHMAAEKPCHCSKIISICCILYFVHFVVPMGISPWEIWVAFNQGKPAATVALQP